MAKKLNTFTLSGLIVGPILGSGIVLLPPLAYELMGEQAMYPWLIIMALGGVFAYVFTQLSILSPGNEGVAIAIGKALGPASQEVASNFLISAVCFGPVAVLMTASQYIIQMFPLGNTALISILLLALSVSILLRGVQLLGKITLILSSFISLLLLIGGLYTLISVDEIHLPTGVPPFQGLGYTLLLLFWAIIGWEIIGNYVEDVDNPQKTLNKSMVISLIIITTIYLTSAFALQNLVVDSGTLSPVNMSLILVPLFKGFAVPLLGLAASGLCISTYLMIVGGVSRLIASKSEKHIFPHFLSKKNKAGSPINAILALTLLHALSTTGSYFGWVNLESLVALANAFFIGNAILGLAAGFVLFKNIWIKIPILILIGAFSIMFFFSNPLTIFFVAVVGGLSYYRSKKHTTRNSGLKKSASL